MLMHPWEVKRAYSRFARHECPHDQGCDREPAKEPSPLETPRVKQDLETWT